VNDTGPPFGHDGSVTEQQPAPGTSPARTRLSALQLLLVTDDRGDAAVTADLVKAAVQGGVRAVQLRERKQSARDQMRLCDPLRWVQEAVEGLLLVNDRLDVARGHAHGGHIGGHSLPPAEARVLLMPDQALGVSVHDEGQLADAAAAAADFALLSPVLPTSSKPGAPYLGLARAGVWTSRSKIPVVWLGGIDATAAARLRELPQSDRPIGVAVRSAICSASSPAAAARALLAAMR
jgi:thiamine-phosphate pyrophosphorylase